MVTEWRTQRLRGMKCTGEGGLVSWHLRSRSKALPTPGPNDFSLRLTLSALITISEPSRQSATAVRTALDALSDVELERCTEPRRITSAWAADAYMAGKQAQSSQYVWRQQDGCLFLLARSEVAKSRGAPGVVFELIIRTGASTWTAYQVPELGEILDSAGYLERNELVAYSPRPTKSGICPKLESRGGRLHRLGRALSRFAATLFA
jgi:hypothetical protein